MASPWCRLWADMPNDPKWRTIARASGQSIGNVVAVYIHMMTCASTQPNATERGRTIGWRDEDVATALDIETEQVSAILAAMEGRVLDGDYLTGWDRRQSIREDEGAAQRAKDWREKEKARKLAEKNADKTQPNATERNRTTEVEVEVKVDVEKNKTQPATEHMSEGRAVRAVDLSIAFRASGIQTQPANPVLIELASQGVQPETVTAACEEAKAAKPGEQIGLGYVAAILKRWAADASKVKVQGAARPEARGSPSKQPSRHSGFENMDYNEGIENGRIT